MFTGIVQGLGTLVARQDSGGVRQLRIGLPEGRGAGLVVGASVAINGVCLTVVKHDGDEACFDVIDETLRLTNLGALDVGATVKIERAARFGDEIGGHVLSGHIMGLASVIAVEARDANLEVVFETPAALHKYLLPKGYAAFNGVSLTLGETIQNGRCSVHLIPETRRLTTFGSARVGDQLNLEVDAQTQAIVDTVERVLAERL